MKQLLSRLNYSKLLAQIVVFVAVGSIGTFYLVHSYANGNATFALTPASSAITLGSTFTVTIVENSGTVPVNAFEADLTYDQTKLQFVSVNTTGSPFTLGARADGGSGAVVVASASTTTITGQQNVAVITFKALATGSTNVSFGAGSGIAQASDSTNALSATGLTGATYTISDKTAPSVPTGLTSSGATATSTTLNWASATDDVAVTGYKIYRSGTQIGTSVGTNYTVTGLAPSNTYSFTVAAYDAAGNTSAQSSALSASTTADTTTPGTPTNLTVGTRTLTSIALSWTAASDNVGVSGYKIYRGGTQVGTSTTTSYTANGLSPNTSYSFTVAAYDAAGNTSAQSSAGSYSTLADTAAPTVPSTLTLTGQTSTSVSFSWSASSDNVGVAGYKIYRGGTQVGTSASPTYTASGLSIGNTYSFTVAAYDAAGNTSAQSAASSYTTQTKLGDANGDNQVDYLDLSLLATYWQSTTNLQADFNHDGIINYLDLSILASNWGK